MNESFEKVLTQQYRQFILDDTKIPSIEIISSSHITTLFINKCYENALNQLLAESSEKKSLLISSYKHACSDLSKIFPNELVFIILKDFCQINKLPTLSFELFHDQFQRNNPSKEVVDFCLGMRFKQLDEKNEEFIRLEKINFVPFEDEISKLMKNGKLIQYGLEEPLAKQDSRCTIS